MVLELSKEECDAPLWQHLLRNGAVYPNDVLIREVQEDVEGPLNNLNAEIQDEVFSDEENESSDEEDDEATSRQDMKLRKYQEELAAPAISGRNTIVCAPTGSGKTKVAIHVMLEHLKSTPNAKIAFFARTQPLAKQQYMAIKRHLPDAYDVFLMTGGSCQSMSLHQLLPLHSVAVLTPMILVNHLRGTRALLEEGIAFFTMFVFDECHHTRKEEPYNNIMYYYITQKMFSSEKPLPQIVGLTASIGVEKATKPEQAEGSIKEVCANLDVDNIVTVKENLDELKKIVPVPNELGQPLVIPEDNVAITEIKAVMATLERLAKGYAQEINNETISRMLQCIPPNRKLQEYCQWVVKLCDEAQLVHIPDSRRETNMPVRYLIIITRYLKSYHFALESLDLVQVEDVMKFLDRCFSHFQDSEDKTDQEIAFYSYFTNLKDKVNRRHLEPNPNLTILEGALREYVLGKGVQSRAIVFVHTLMLAEAVTSWLNRCGDPDLEGLQARRFTGTNALVELGGMTKAEQHDILEQFRRGHIRVLVATPVAEEGLDIPECNLIIKYNYTGSEVSKVQSRGRGRALDAVSILLALPKIRDREEKNNLRVKLMEDAIDKISKMESKDLKSFVDRHQAFLVREWREKEAAEEQMRLQMQDVHFRLICNLCRKVLVHSTKIRTIYGKYRVAIDRFLLDNIKVMTQEEEEIDEIKFVGTAFCLSGTEDDRICGNKLGCLIKHRACPFVTLGIKNILFQAEEGGRPEKYKKWKDVPYVVSELENQELLDYATGLFLPEGED